MAVTSKGIPIRGFNEYMEIVSDFADGLGQDLCLFRGQPCDKPLVPNLGRLGLENIRQYEADIFADFAKRYRPYCPKTCDNDFDLLALGQHFGLPTRLMDWTESALVGLWFATETDITDHHSVVWMFSPAPEDILDTKEPSPFEVNSTRVFCPNHISARITSQSGWFTCHHLKENDRFLRFERLKKYHEKLIKIEVPRTTFPEIRVKLNMLGVNAATVYPDLSGLARHLKWKHLKAERF
ncbi:MAG: FRG domain-containing protein [Rikenellaceae bacterium]|nr:FRG domain-containing protein [Rikenellaceae bacterium]